MKGIILKRLFSSVEFPCDYRVCYYDYDKQERVWVDPNLPEYAACRVLYIYCEVDEVIIEIDFSE